jgi:hypothetical protein
MRAVGSPHNAVRQEVAVDVIPAIVESSLIAEAWVQIESGGSNTVIVPFRPSKKTVHVKVGVLIVSNDRTVTFDVDGIAALADRIH